MFIFRQRFTALPCGEAGRFPVLFNDRIINSLQSTGDCPVGGFFSSSFGDGMGKYFVSNAET